jgi:hypothetical protein
MDLPKNIEFIFYHIEKCGGTSFRDAFNTYFLNMYKQKHIFIPEKSGNIKYNFLPEHLEVIKGNDVFEFKKLKVILSHIRYNSFPTLNTLVPLKITVIRHPIDRVISHYYFFDYKKTNCQMVDLPKEEFEKFCRIHCSHITNSMGCLDNDCNIDKTLCEQRIQEFSFIGLLENIDKDIIIINNLLNTYYKCDYTIDVPHKNATKHVTIKNNLALKKRIEEYCSNDIYFYDMVKKHRQL